MKFLLTSAGITNTSIQDALVDFLGKPSAEASALCFPTAIYPSKALAWQKEGFQKGETACDQRAKTDWQVPGCRSEMRSARGALARGCHN